jgi:hypothetical protein
MMDRLAKLISIALLFSASGCNFMQAPASSQTTATFSHVGLAATCIGCHVPDRPTTLVKSYLHSYSAHGMEDCVECHSQTQAGISWTGAYHQHAATTGLLCTTCHVNDRPTIGLNFGTNGTLTPAAAGVGHYPTKDCIQCHLPPLTQAAATAAAGTFVFSHVDSFGDTPGTCLPCHLLQGQVALPAAMHGPNVGDCVRCHTPGGF